MLDAVIPKERKTDYIYVSFSLHIHVLIRLHISIRNTSKALVEYYLSELISVAWKEFFLECPLVCSEANDYTSMKNFKV